MTPQNQKPAIKDYNNLIENIGAVLEQGRRQAYNAVNHILINAYWEIGRQIVEYENKNKESAGYGTKLFERIAKDLRERHGKRFSRSNVIYMRLFCLKYQKSQTLSD